MENKLSAIQISSVVNEEPLVVEIDVKTWRGKTVKRFEITPPTIGQLIRISTEVEKIAGAEDIFKHKDYASILKHFALNGEAVVNILSIYIGNKPGLKKLIKKYFTITDCSNLLVRLVDFSNLQDFTTTIILTKGMSLINTEEIIASERDKNPILPEPLEV